MIGAHTTFLYMDSLSYVIIGLVGFIGSIILGFASRYLRGDSRYTPFMLTLVGLLLSVMALSVADHVVLFTGLWATANVLLVRLMIHHRSWKQAVASGKIAGFSLGMGVGAIGIGLGALSYASHSTSISHIILYSGHSWLVVCGLGFILIGAFAQSAIFPFHRWLLSSLNSPTPVSAIMHAGLINGGGILLTRFAPLYLQHPFFLKVMIVLGMITAGFGTAFKLIQPDVKRMLACSTMGQMGFMIVQCGLGLFPAAISHLVWHGMFKAYFFLDSASAGQYPKLNKPEAPSVAILVSSVLGGIAASITATVLMNTSTGFNSTAVITVVIGLAGTQGMITFLQKEGIRRMGLGVLLAAVMGGLYGGSVRLVEHAIRGLHCYQPQPFSLLHAGVIAVLIGLWSIITIGPMISKKKYPRLYVWLLNQSQPHPSTITAYRNHYNYGQ